jgi:hypothetical protein
VDNPTAAAPVEENQPLSTGKPRCHHGAMNVQLLAATTCAVVLISGCSAAVAEPRTYVGQVTEVDDGTVCIGAAAARGECFVKDRVTRQLRVNDCVQVTYVPQPEQQVPSTADEVIAVPLAGHADDCPRPGD